MLRAAKVEHLLGLGEAADGEREALSPHDQLNADISIGFFGRADESELPSRRSRAM